MGILIRNQGGKWESVAKVQFTSENQLQELLYTSPELLAEEGNAVAVFTREAGLPGSGYTDLIGVNSDGDVLIVETKLAKNPEIRRKVIGQVVEYAAYLWQMSFDQFDAFFVKAEGRSVVELVADHKPDVDKINLRQRISEHLSRGDFTLLIAVDEINPELDRIIAYLSSRQRGIDLEALEFEAYRHGTLDLMVPHPHGQIEVTEPPGKTKTIEEILASCKDEHSRALFGRVVHDWQEAGNAIVPGTVGASFRAQVGDDQEVVFWAYPDSLQAGFNHLLTQEGAPPNLVEEYRGAVSRIKGFNPATVLKLRLPNTRWDALNETAVREFLAETHNFVSRWRSAVALGSEHEKMTANPTAN